MREELIKFLEERNILGYQLDAGSEEIVRQGINDFFDLLQSSAINRKLLETPAPHIMEIFR